MAALLISACSVVSATQSLFGGVFPVEAEISPEVNQDSALAVDIVVVYNKKILDKLREMPARDWFETRDQLVRDHAKEIEPWSFEWVPGQQIEPLEISYRTGADTAVIFADYFAPGEHRLVVEIRKPVRLVLDTDGMRVEALK